MGVEYYLVKPDRKEIFYLGKHVESIDCIRNSAGVADYIEVDCYSDFLLQCIESNDGFLDDCYTYSAIKEFVYLLYEWCDDKVYFSNDCCGDYQLWKDYKETGSIVKFCEEHEKDCVLN